MRLKAITVPLAQTEKRDKQDCIKKQRLHLPTLQFLYKDVFNRQD